MVHEDFQLSVLSLTVTIPPDVPPSLGSLAEHNNLLDNLRLLSGWWRSSS